MVDFTYHIPTKMYFGKDHLKQLGPELKAFGEKVLLVYGGGSIKKTGLYDRILAETAAAGLTVTELPGVEPNPGIGTVRKGIAVCREQEIDAVLAVGGGSVIDTAKWVAAGTFSDFDPWEFFSRWAPVTKSLPVVTVVTITGTGSEMDCSGVISNPETHDKIGRSDPQIFPKVSFLDPTLTFSVGRYQTACGAIDIFSHVAETYFNVTPDFFMLDQAMEGIMQTVLRYAPVALAEPSNYEARANLMWAAPWAINGFAVGGKRQSWSSHRLEHELSARYPITHGEGIAILMVNWLRYCLNETTLPKYVQFARNVFHLEGCSDRELAEQSVAQLEAFCVETLGLSRRLKDLGVQESDIPVMAEKACRGGVINGFVPLRQPDIETIFRMCL